MQSHKHTRTNIQSHTHTLSLDVFVLVFFFLIILVLSPYYPKSVFLPEGGGVDSVGFYGNIRFYPTIVVVRNIQNKTFNLNLRAPNASIAARLQFCRLGVTSFDESADNYYAGESRIELLGVDNSILPYQSSSLPFSRLSVDGSCVSLHAEITGLSGLLSFSSVRVIFTPPDEYECAAEAFPIPSGNSHTCVNRSADPNSHFFMPVSPPVDFVAVFTTAADNNNNSNTNRRVVSLDDTIPPTITGCPSNQTVAVTTFADVVNVSWIVPFATDNLAILSRLPAEFQDPGSLFHLSIPTSRSLTAYTYTAVDTSNLVKTCT